MSFYVTTSKQKKEPENLSGPICPGCGKHLSAGSGYCYHCNHFLDSSGTRVLRCGEVTQQDIEALIRRSDLAMDRFQNDPGTIKSRKALLMGVAGMLLGAIMVIFGSVFTGVALMIGSIFATVIVTSKVAPAKPVEILEGDNFSSMISSYVTPAVLEKVFDSVESYEPRGRISPELISKAALIYRDYNVSSGSQHIRGVYHGVPVELCNLHCQYKTEDEDGRSSYSEAFEGIWMICDFGVPVRAEIRMWTKVFGIHLKRAIVTDNQQFNQRFLVSCADEAEAFRFLTPQVMEQILKLDAMAGGKIRILVQTDGKICIAVDAGRSILRTANNDEAIPQMRERMTQELLYPLNLVDSMNSAHLNR